jgi:hypothetical protein
MVCQLIPATMQLRDPKTNARCVISGTVTELSNVKWNDKKVKQNVFFLIKIDTMSKVKQVLQALPLFGKKNTFLCLKTT